MSGGSFGYLYLKDINEIFSLGEDHHYHAMLKQIRELDPTNPAVATMEMIISDYQHLNDLKHTLDEVFHAVEWYVSCDCDEQHALDELARYKKAFEAES